MTEQNKTQWKYDPMGPWYDLNGLPKEQDVIFFYDKDRENIDLLLSRQKTEHSQDEEAKISYNRTTGEIEITGESRLIRENILAIKSSPGLNKKAKALLTLLVEDVF